MDNSVIKQFVIFGATGDLTSRFLLPALAELAGAGHLPKDFQITASGTTSFTSDEFRDHVERQLNEFAQEFGDQWDWLIERVQYHQADVTDPDEVQELLRTSSLQSDVSTAFYLALPTGLMPIALQSLAGVGLPHGSRIAIEKPFGTDVEDAKQLALLIGELFGEDAHRLIYNVDHALAMAPVQSLLPLRLTNPFPEVIWNSTYIEEIQVLWEESLALEGRAGFYDGIGALKDVMQNHMMLILALAAMELDNVLHAGNVDIEQCRNNKVELLKAVQIWKVEDAKEHSNRARYTAGTIQSSPDEDVRDVPDYVNEDGVDPSLETETFAEVVLQIDTPRWRGTRFRLRTGKALAKRRKGLEVLFRPTGPTKKRGAFWIGVDGPLDVELTLNTRKTPTELSTIQLHSDQPQADLRPYAHVLHDLLRSTSVFHVSIEEALLAWEIVTPVIRAWERNDVPMGEYTAGSDGPDLIGH